MAGKCAMEEGYYWRRHKTIELIVCRNDVDVEIQNNGSR